MKTELTTTIAQNIKKYRKLHGLTQEQMADKLNLDAQYYSMLERSDAGRAFSIEKISMVCELFDVGIEDIVDVRKKEEKEENQEMKQKIIEKLDDVSETQMMVLAGFMENILPYVK